MKQVFLLLVVTIYLAVGVSAQEYGFDVWTTADGLPQNTVNGLAQTPDGYLWLATFDGLARFDGVRFVVFDRSNSKGIVNNRFVKIFADKEGTIWASTENGVLTVYRNGVFTSYSTPEGLRESITSIEADSEGNARIETSENYYYIEDGKFALAPDQKKRGEQTVYFGKSGAKWIFTTKEVSHYKDGIVTRYPLQIDPVTLINTNYGLTYEDNRGALWFTLNSPQTYKLYRLQNGEITVFTQDEIPELKKIYPLIVESDGSICFVFAATIQQDPLLTFVHLKDGNFSRWQFKEFNTIADGLVDREGNVWLGTHQGLKRFRRQLITNLSEKDGLLSNEVYPLLQSDNGDIFIGSIKGVNRFSDGKITDLGLKFDNPNKAFLIRGLWEDQQKQLWIGSSNGSGRVENDSLKVINPNWATDFTSDRNGNLWMATDSGLIKYKDEKEIARYTVENGLPHNEVITIHEDRIGNIWVGTFDGLAMLSEPPAVAGGSNVSTETSRSNGATRPLPQTVLTFNNVENSPKGFVRYIYEDADGILWFGTYGDGLVRYKDGKFFNYRVEHGLFNNGVFAILEDKRGNFWMSSNRGIHRVSKQELNDFADGRIPKLNSVSYDESDGMLNVECNGGRMSSAIKTKDGKFWFPTMGGVAIVDPNAETVNTNPPPTIIEDISIDRKSAIPNPKSEIEMKPNQTSLEIHYTGLSLIKSNQIKFRYKLEGFEENWTEAGTNRTANYSYLPAGNYTFRVIAANANGVWNTEGAALKIIVHPVFYQTWWFLTLATLTVALVVWLIYHNRVSQLQKIASAKSEFSRRLIESQEAERKRIAAELHDGLGQSLAIISNRAAMGKNNRNEPELVFREFDEISKDALEALDEVQEITAKLHPRYLERLGLTKALKTMFVKVSDVLEFDYEIDVIDGVFPKDAEINVYRIVQESVNNIIKHSDAAEAEVKIKKFADTVLITIKDDGRGFDTIKVKPSGSGLGLVGLKERTNMIGGTISINSSVGNGTEIKISLPLKSSELRL